MTMTTPILSKSWADSPVSSSEGSSSQPEKRKRASKPKVRTGCITWIRRVKCGEEKPACARCTSTGRACDGYDNGATPRTQTQDSFLTTEIARKDFVRSHQFNEALQCGRLIVADIEGTEMEKRFFHRFRLAVTDSLGSHICSSSAFCNRLLPQMSHQHEAVKHAAIALGSAYQLFQLPHATDARNTDGFSRSDLEVLTIQQYNRSISELQHHASSSSPESIQVTLVCCLSFICLETFRGNYDAAMTHLRNGLKILDSLPTEYFEFLAADTARDADVATSHLDMQFGDMRDIIQLFGRLETSACFFASNIRPILAAKGYEYRKFDDGSYTEPKSGFRSLREVHQAYTYFLRDVLARLYEITRTDIAGLRFSRDTTMEMRQQECLHLRAARLETLMELFTAGPYAPGPDTPENLCLQLDLLHFCCAQTILATADDSLGYQGRVSASPSPLPSPSLSVYSSDTPPPFPPPTHYNSPIFLPTHYSSSLLSPPSHIRLTTLSQPATPTIPCLQADMLAIATNLVTFPPIHHTSRETISFSNAGIVGPLYLVAVTSPDASLRAQATSLLGQIDDGFGGFFWDGPRLRERLGLVVGGDIAGGGIPFIQDALERLVG